MAKTIGVLLSLKDQFTTPLQKANRSVKETKDVIKIMDSTEEKTTEAAYNANCKLIYKHCPILHDKELQKTYEVAQPYEIVIPVFDENLGEINKLSNFILNLYGLGEESDKASKVLEEEIEDIKN